jgi:hypothetical protein
MNYTIVGNFEIYPDPINWSVPNKPNENYYQEDNLDYLLDEFIIDEIVESLGEGWRLPDSKEMNYLNSLMNLGIMGNQLFRYYPYIIKESVDPKFIDSSIRIFYNPVTKSTMRQPWIPGYFLSESGPRNFKIQAVRNI